MNYITKKIVNPTLIGLGLLAFSANTEAAIIFYFEQVGNDVKVSGVGSLNLANSMTTETLTPTDSVEITFTSLTRLYATATNGYLSGNFGASSTVMFGGDDHANYLHDRPNRTFGFKNQSLFFDTSDITGGSHPSSVSQITWAADKHFYFIRSATLVDLGVDSFNNTLAWTAASTNDTISYQTGAAPIPEPSSAVLTLVGGFGLLLRRNKSK